MSAAIKVAKAALTDWQSGGESRGQRSAVEDVETYLPGTRWRAAYDSGRLLHNAWSSAKADRPKAGEEKVSALQHNHESGSPEKQIELWLACCCDLRRQRAGLPQGNRILSAPVTEMKTWIENNPGSESGWKRSL